MQKLHQGFNRVWFIYFSNQQLKLTLHAFVLVQRFFFFVLLSCRSNVPTPLYTCSSENVAHKMNLSDDPHQGNSLCNGGVHNVLLYFSLSPFAIRSMTFGANVIFEFFFRRFFFSSLVKFRLTSTCFRCINFTRVDSSCFTSHPPKCLRCIWVDVKLLLFGCDFA